ncbi:MAG: universal stress protein [Opitutales bacterium]
MIKNLLICTDGSNYAKECCHYGAWLAKQTGAKVDILYVTDLRQFEVPAVADLSGSLGIQPYEGMINHLHQVEQLKSGFIEEQAMELFREEGLEKQTTFHHETGLLVETMEDYTEKADLILLGKRGENADFASKHLGAMMERVVRAAEKPCLATSRKFKPITRVTLAYDGGDSCRKALRFIGENELFKAMDLRVVTVIEGHKEEQAAQRLEEAEKLLKESGLQPVCQTLSGDVETAIAEYVERNEMDLLIAGAYGHSRIRELLIGSTTTELLRRCYIPVLCFR